MTVNGPDARRIRWLGFAFAFWFAAIAAQLVKVDVYRHDDYARMAARQQTAEIQVSSPRAPIFDRNGTLLAATLPGADIAINPLRIRDGGTASRILSGILLIDQASLLHRIEESRNARRGFLIVKRKALPREVASMRSLNLDWLDIRPNDERIYPQGSLAAHVLGWLDWKHEGAEGIEQTMGTDLSGHPGEMRVQVDALRRSIQSAEILTGPEPARPVTLTIDWRIQASAEKHLAESARKWASPTGAVVAIDARTAEILALASFPAYDPAHPPESATLPDRINRATRAPFEPGNLIQPLVIASALEQHSITPDQLVDAGTSLALGSRVFRESGNRMGVLPLSEILSRSSNLGTMRVGLLAAAGLERSLRQFGFGRKTGIPLPSESAGVLPSPRLSDPDAIASLAGGYGLTATLIQLSRAYLALANGGILVDPILIRSPVESGREDRSTSKVAVRVLGSDTCGWTAKALTAAVESGTGTEARIPGYTAAGKTSTTQDWNPALRAYTNRFTASFVGFAPAAKPRIVIAVALWGGTGNGGGAAAPVFQAVAGDTLRLLSEPGDAVAPKPAKSKGNTPVGTLETLSGPPAPASELTADVSAVSAIMPSLAGLTGEEAVRFAARNGFVPMLHGKGIVVAQRPGAGKPVAYGSVLHLELQ